MHLQPFLVQSFVLISEIEIYFEEIVQNFELKRIGGALKGHQLTPPIKRLASS